MAKLTYETVTVPVESLLFDIDDYVDPQEIILLAQRAKEQRRRLRFVTAPWSAEEDHQIVIVS